MPSSQKSTKTSPGDASQAARVKPKTGQQQAAKSGGSVAKPDSQEEKAATEDQEAPKGTERKTSAKLSTTKERASTGQTLATRPRKLTPQQQVHLARARRRRLRERMWLGFGALLVVGVIAVVAWQVIAKNAESTRQANQHAAATATAAVHATATQTALNILEPETPPAVTGKTITTKDGLQYIDIKVGKGTAIKQGDTFNARYVGWNVPANCQVVDVCQFDSSYYENIQQNKDPMTPTQFQLVGPNQNGVIQGWVEGVAGMKPGGKRRLIIPAALAYGSQAQSSAPEQAIPANATLIFDIELVSISNTSTPTPAPTPSG